MAAERKHSKLLHFLLQNGAKHTEQKTQNEGNSVLHLACLQEDLKSVKILLDHDSSKSKESGAENQLLYLVNKHNQTALDLLLVNQH